MASFWDLLLDWQRESSHHHHHKTRHRDVAVGVARDTSLADEVARQAGEIALLRAVLGALAGTLRDSLAQPGTVDAAVLDARLEAAIEEALLPPERLPVPADPAVRIVTCVRCAQDVPAATTIMTAEGFACDRCPPPPG